MKDIPAAHNVFSIDDDHMLVKMKGDIFRFQDFIGYEVEKNNTAIMGGGIGSTGLFTAGWNGFAIPANCYRLMLQIYFRNCPITFTNIGFIQSAYPCYGKTQSSAINIMYLCIAEIKRIVEMFKGEETVTWENENSQQNYAMDIPAEIKKYKELFDQGIITEEEFNNKKTQLLYRNN